MGFETFLAICKQKARNLVASITMPSKKSTCDADGCWRNSNGRLHREDGPAQIKANGAEEWYFNGLMHRDGGPAKIRPALGKTMRFGWYQHGKLHREDGPAIIIGKPGPECSMIWYLNGKIHRLGGPAVDIGQAPERTIKHYQEKMAISRQSRIPFYYGLNRGGWTNYYGDKEWRVHGKLHRVDGPAFERLDGTKKWCRHGRLHREGAPAVEYPKGSKEWWIKGRLHRDEGPAVDVAENQTIWNLAYTDLSNLNHNQIHYAKLWRMKAEEWPSEPLRWGASRLNRSGIPIHHSHKGKEWWVKGHQLTVNEFHEFKERRMLRRSYNEE